MIISNLDGTSEFYPPFFNAGTSYFGGPQEFPDLNDLQTQTSQTTNYTHPFLAERATSMDQATALTALLTRYRDTYCTDTS